MRGPTVKTSHEFLPCPFCGSDNVGGDVRGEFGETLLSFTECRSCGARSRKSPYGDFALRAWNSRASEGKWQPIRCMPISEAVLAICFHGEDMELDIVAAQNRDDVIDLAKRYTHFLKIWPWPVPDLVPRPSGGEGAHNED